MKRYLTLLILIAAGTFIFGCRPRILKLNLPEEGAVKLEYLPMDLSPAYGLEVTDPEDIKEFIKEINQFSFYRYRNTALLNGEAVNVRISYEDGTHSEFLDMGTILRLSDGNWLKAAGDSPQISDYFRKNYNYYCRPKMKNLRLQERGIQKLEYEPAYLPAEYGAVITDRETIQKLADALSSFSCYLCTNPTGIRTPYGSLIITYQDGRVEQYGDAKEYMQLPDGTWWGSSEENRTLGNILKEFMEFDYDRVQKSAPNS